MEQLPQTNPITTSKDSFTPFSPKDLEPPSDIPDSDVFLDQEDDSSEETRSRSGIFKKPSDISKKKYHYIPDDLRLKLIDEVENKGEKIKHAAKKLNINYSSAKSICQIYRKEGRSNKKISKRKGLKEEFTKLIQEMKQTGATFGGNSPPVLVNQPPMAEENTQTEASSDTLTALRDRLLQSRAKSRLEYGETPMENNGLEIRKDFSDGIMSQPGDSQQQAYQEPQKPMGFVPANNQGPAKYVTAYMPMQMPQAQTVYYLIPMQNMGYPQAQNAPQQNSMQSFSFGGPSQTININQPQANTISTQSISITNTSSGQQTQSETSFGTQGLYSYGGFNPMNQMIPQQVQPQIQYQQIPVQGQQNGGYMALQQNPQGMQMMRPMIYIMPQNGLNGNGIYQQQQQQVPQTNINYYNPNQKLMQFSNGLEGQMNQIQNENGNFKQDLIDTQSDQYNIAAKQN